MGGDSSKERIISSPRGESAIIKTNGRLSTLHWHGARVLQVLWPDGGWDTRRGIRMVGNKSRYVAPVHEGRSLNYPTTIFRGVMPLL